MPSVFSRYCHKTQNIKPSAQINKYDADGILELLKDCDQDITLENLLEIHQQSFF
jgi:hypothetical protein